MSWNATKAAKALDARIHLSISKTSISASATLAALQSSSSGQSQTSGPSSPLSLFLILSFFGKMSQLYFSATIRSTIDNYSETKTYV
jgi:hypothetical protein